MRNDHGYQERGGRVDHLLATPIPYDWTAWHADDSEDRPWEWAETLDECPRCKRANVVAVNGAIEEHDESDGSDPDDMSTAVSCRASGDYVREAEGPQMNYWYPVTFPGDMADAARVISHLPLCAVTVDGKEGIALTGGGMDLSWEICEAYMLLGCAPPYHFASDLPDMSGRLDARCLEVLAACDRSISILAMWTANATERNANLRRRMSERTLGPANMAGITDADLVTAESIAHGASIGLDEERVLYLCGLI
jgi:hypothetical protein